MAYLWISFRSEIKRFSACWTGPSSALIFMGKCAKSILNYMIWSQVSLCINGHCILFLAPAFAFPSIFSPIYESFQPNGSVHSDSSKSILRKISLAEMLSSYKHSSLAIYRIVNSKRNFVRTAPHSHGGGRITWNLKSSQRKSGVVQGVHRQVIFRHNVNWAWSLVIPCRRMRACPTRLLH